MKNNHLLYPLFFSMTYDFLETYLPKQCGRSPHTVKSYRDALSLFRRYVLNEVGIPISKFTFVECTRKKVLGFMDYLTKRGSKPSTRNQRLATLKSYISFASDKNISLQSIALEIKRVPQCKTPQTDKIVIPEEAMKAILNQPSNTKMGIRDRTIMILLYDTGTRLAEILGLSITDVVITGDNPYIRVHGKGSKERIVPISMKTVKHLTRYISVFHGNVKLKTTLLFYTIIKNMVGNMSEGNVERFIKGYAEKAKLFCPSVPEKVNPHMFRRTRATELYQNGVSLPLVSRFLGHASLETTKIYAKPSLKMLRDAIESVETSTEKNEQPLWEDSEEIMAKLCGLR